MQAILSLFLAAAMTLSVPGRFAADGTAAVSLPSGVDWEDMTYTRYDPELFSRQTGELAALGEAGDTDAALALYDALYAELVHIATLSSIAYIHYSLDVTDAYWSEQTVYCDKLTVRAADALKTACHDLLQGPCAEAFAGHVGPAAAEVLGEYVPMTAREAELTAREAELVDEYYEKLNGADAVTYSYLGQTWDMDMITGFQGMSLAYQDYEGYLEVYYGLQKAVNDQVGPVFTDLVALRAELAGLEGYDSYADLAYEQIYGRDYTCGQAQELCDAVKAIGKEYYTGAAWHSELWDETDTVYPIMGGVELLDTLGRYADRIDPALPAYCSFMTDHGLCCLTDGEDSLPSSYTTTLDEYGSSYIFVGLTGSSGDLGTLVHEFGHFAYNCLHPGGDLLTDTGSFDLLEVHSTGLEALFTAFYDEIYIAGADPARFAALSDLIEAVVDGCILDEFQRRVYAQPDMTLDEMNRLYAGLCMQYGRYEPTGVDYAWMYIHHNFESPLYYISYAVSALAAIQIWDLSQQDFAAGADAWRAVLAHDAYTEGYLDVMDACGLRRFTESGAAEDICRPLLEALARLDAES